MVNLTTDTAKYNYKMDNIGDILGINDPTKEQQNKRQIE